jgi:hypothetical protein
MGGGRVTNMTRNTVFSNLRSKATKTTPSITAKDQDSSQNTTDTLHATLASQESLATNREPGFRVDMNEHPEEPDQKQSSGLCYYNNLCKSEDLRHSVRINEK